MKDFHTRKVWQKSHQFALAVYKTTNIAEGTGRCTDKDFARFLQIPMGSASEAEYQLLLARDLRFMNDEQYNTLQSQIVEVKKMLASFLRTLRR